MPKQENKVAVSWQWACSTCRAQPGLGGARSWHHSLLPACPGRQTKGCLHMAVWQNTAVAEHISKHSTAWALNIQNIFCFPVFSSHQPKQQGISVILSAEAKTITWFFPCLLLEIYCVQHSQTSLKICILPSLHSFLYFSLTVKDISINLFDWEHFMEP